MSRLELLAYLSPHDQGNFWHYLMPSLALFWPSARITAVLEDTEEDRALAAALPARYRACFTRRYRDAPFGRERLQLLKFHVDECASPWAVYIGFVDSDTLFTTWVTEASIFDGHRPRVIAEVGRPKNLWYSGVPRATRAYLRHDEELGCMSYFPQVYWREHLPSLRAHLQEIHGGAPGEEGFEGLARSLYPGGPEDRYPPFIEFNVLCNYVFRAHADSYAFHAHEITPGWRGPLSEGQANVSTVLAELDASPVARVAIHAGSMDELREIRGAQHVVLTKCGADLPLACRWFARAASKMQEGFCRSHPARGASPALRAALCGSCSACRGELHRDLFRFELVLTIDWATTGRKPQGCKAAQLRHYASVARGPPLGCPQARILAGLLELGNLSANEPLDRAE